MHLLIHPDYTVHTDELGGDTSRKGGDHIGGMNFITSTNKIPKTVTARNNNHFTVMFFTAGNGKPVMCIFVIIDVRNNRTRDINISVCGYGRDKRKS